MPLPYHKSEKLFRHYEPFIAKIVEAFPKVIVFQPPEKEHTTFVARMRNLKTSLAENRFSTFVDMKKFDSIGHSKIIIADDTTRVICGSALAISNFKNSKDKVEVVPTASILDTSTDVDFGALSPEQLHVVCELSARRALRMPVKLTILPEIAEKLEQNYDINLVNNGQGSYTLT